MDNGLTDLVLDATELKFQFATNYDVGSLMFSHYKNHSTSKALIGTSPHGIEILFSDVYPGSISDSEITSKTDILNFVRRSLNNDRPWRFDSRLCSEKGITLNRSKQKEHDQFSSGSVPFYSGHTVHDFTQYQNQCHL